MANHAHSTRTPLLPPAGAQSALLPRGAGRQLGPVTSAIAIMRAADPTAGQSAKLRRLRRAIADRIEADIALLDALDTDPEFETEEPEASAVEWTGAGAHRFNCGVAA